MLICAVAALFLAEAKAFTVFPIATNAGLVEISGPVLIDGTNYLAGLVSGTNISVQRFSGNGLLLGSQLNVGANPGFPPATAFCANQCNVLAAWSDSTASGVAIFGQLLTRSGLPIGVRFNLLQSAGSHGFQQLQGVASDGTNFLAVWQDQSNRAIYAQLITSAGTLSGSETNVSAWPDNGRSAAVAFGRTNYLVAWQSENGDPQGLLGTYCAFVSPSGCVSSPVQVSQTGSPSYNPLAIAFDRVNYLVIWNRDIGPGFPAPTDWDIYGRIVADDGSLPGSEVVLVGDPTSEVLPSVAFDGCNYLLAWTDNLFNGTNYGIRFRFFDRAANPVGSSFSVFTNHGNNVPLITLNGLLFDGGRYVVAATLGTIQTNASGKVIGIPTADVYGAFIPVVAPTLNLQLITNQCVLSWNAPSFSLQSAPMVTGTYTNIPGATSAYTNTITTEPSRFFRLILTTNCFLTLRGCDNTPVVTVSSNAKDGGIWGAQEQNPRSTQFGVYVFRRTGPTSNPLRIDFNISRTTTDLTIADYVFDTLNQTLGSVTQSSHRGRSVMVFLRVFEEFHGLFSKPV